MTGTVAFHNGLYVEAIGGTDQNRAISAHGAGSLFLVENGLTAKAEDTAVFAQGTDDKATVVSINEAGGVTLIESDKRAVWAYGSAEDPSPVRQVFAAGRFPASTPVRVFFLILYKTFGTELMVRGSSQQAGASGARPVQFVFARTKGSKMNATFKVVFNKARGALMVVNEVTSSVQAKGTKTVVAVAAAAAMTSAMAADAEPVVPPAEEEAPVVDTSLWTDKTVSSAETVKAGETVKIHSAVIGQGGSLIVQGNVDRDPQEVNGEKTSVLSVEQGGKVTVETTGNLQVNDLSIAGDVTATGTEEWTDEEHGRTTPAVGAYKSFVMTDGKLELSQGGRAWIGSTWSKDPEAYGRMELKGGEVTLKDGGYITGNKRLVKAGEYYAAEDDGHETVKVEEDTLAANVIGFDGAAVTVEGSKNVVDAAKTELTAGTLTIKKGGDLTVRASVATNETDAQAAAAQIAKDGYFAVKGGEMNVEKGASFVVADSLKRVEVTGGEVKNAGRFDAGSSDMTLENAVFANTGKLESEGKLTIGKGGVLETAASKSEAFDMEGGVILNEGGLLKFTALNSTFEDPRAAAQAEEGSEEIPAVPVEKPKDQLLIAGTSYTLAGGAMEGVDSVKIGRNDDAAHMTVTKGDYRFENVRLGNSTKTDGASTLNVEGGKLTVTGLLDLRYGLTTVDGGKLALEGEYLTGKNEDTLVVKKGTFATSGANLFDEVKTEAKEGEEKPAAPSYEISDLLEKGDFRGGVIEVTDEGLKLTQAQVVAAVEMLKNAGIGSNLVFSDVTFTDEKLAFDDALGLNGKGQTMEAGASEDGVTTLVVAETTAAVGKLVVDEKTESVTVSKGEGDAIGVLQITGTAEGGNVISGGKDGKVATLDAAALKLGWDEASKGIVNVDEVKVGELSVTGRFSANDVTVKTSGTIAAGSSLAVDDLASAEGADAVFSVDGTLAANTIGLKVELNEGSALVLGERKVNENAREQVKIPQIIGSVMTTGEDVVVTTNAAGEALLKAEAAKVGVVYDASKNVGLYADKTIALDREKGKLLVGDMNVGTKVEGQIVLGSNAVAVIDVDVFDTENAVFDADKVTFNKDAKVVLAGADRITTIKFVEDGIVDGTLNFVSTNAWLHAGTEHVAETGDTMLNVAFHGTGVAALDGFAESVLTTGSDSLGVVNAIGTVYNEGGSLSEVGKKALSEYMSLPVLAGTYNAAYDAAEQVWNTVSARNVSRSGKVEGLWADVFYASNEAKDMYGEGRGYEADVNGGVLGYDYTAECGGKLGVAFSIGSSDVNGTGDTVGKFGNDADFWGLSVYGSKTVTDKMVVSADVTYLSLDNDVTGSVAGASVEESIDSSVLSVALRADWKAYESASFEVVPHAGIRYAQIDVDDYREMNGESLDVLEMPVGVAFSGKFETAGMTFVPTLDFTVVPQIGDTDVKSFDGKALDVLDNTYNATIGVNAVYGDFTFGAAVKYGFGTNDRGNAGVNVKAAYQF